MSLSEKFVNTAKWLLPSPFTIAVLLTLLTAALALLLTSAPVDSEQFRMLEIMGFWEKGFWELLKFSMQMMLMLVLGYILALSKPINRFIDLMLVLIKGNASAAFWVCLLTLCVAWLNWGLGLIFGAIFARKVGEYCLRKRIPLNYPLIGAAGYSGLMVWHGGLSGSAPAKIAETGHFLAEKIGVIPMSETIFSNMNIVCTIVLLLLLPILLFLTARGGGTSLYKIPNFSERSSQSAAVGAERLDHSRLLGTAIGILLVAYCLYKITKGAGLDPNFINLILFSLGILLHGNFESFQDAANAAIGSSTGILIQFPLYGGIMGIMKYSGLVMVFSNFFVEIASANTLPIFTFFSAGLVNIFVPSGGGQWAVQGPIIVDAASRLGANLNECILALAYGDQLTNMLQPFWALPLLGITGLKAQEILPYTLMLLLAGLFIFGGIILVF